MQSAALYTSNLLALPQIMPPSNSPASATDNATNPSDNPISNLYSPAANASTPTAVTNDPATNNAITLSASIRHLQNRFIEGSSGLTRFFNAITPPPLPTGGQPLTQTQQVSQRIEQQLSMQITTKAGDQVQLHLSLHNRSDGLKQVDDQTTSTATQITAQTSLDFTFSVTGDLNAEEQQAISAWVNQLTETVDSFFAVDLPAAVQALGQMSFDTQQIASSYVNLQARAVATYTTTQTYQLAPPAPQKTSAWQAVDQFFTQVLTQSQQLPSFVQDQFLQQLLPTLDWYQSIHQQRRTAPDSA